MGGRESQDQTRATIKDAAGMDPIKASAATVLRCSEADGGNPQLPKLGLPFCVVQLNHPQHLAFVVYQSFLPLPPVFDFTPEIMAARRKVPSLRLSLGTGLTGWAPWAEHRRLWASWTTHPCRADPR